MVRVAKKWVRRRKYRKSSWVGSISMESRGHTSSSKNLPRTGRTSIRPLPRHSILISLSCGSSLTKAATVVWQRLRAATNRVGWPKTRDGRRKRMLLARPRTEAWQYSHLAIHPGRRSSPKEARSLTTVTRGRSQLSLWFSIRKQPSENQPGEIL